MNCKISTVYALTFLLLTTACHKEEYIHSYGPKVTPGIIPYSLGQIIKFENGNNDTITFHCTRYHSFEEVSQSPCSTEEKNCTRIHRAYGLKVDLVTSDHTRTINLSSYGNSVSGHYWTDPNADPGVGKFLLYNSPDSLWLDSIKLNGKKFNNYQEFPTIAIMASEPGNPVHRDTIRYSKFEGVIMFSKEKKSGNLVLSSERWVLVK